MLDGAHLQGASLEKAQLQGASLDYAEVRGASLEKAYLWRAGFADVRAKSVFLGEDFANGRLPNWDPEYLTDPEALEHAGNPKKANPWTNDAYKTLRQSIATDVPKGKARDGALRADCNPRLHADGLGRPQSASCDASAEPPEIVKKGRTKLEAARVDRATYAKALAKILGDLVCANAPDRMDIMRGLLQSDRLVQTGSAMPALTERVMSRKECPGLTGLTDMDRRALLQATEDAVSSAEVGVSCQARHRLHP